MSLWTSDAADKATGGISTALWKATGISIDTRTLVPGDLFVALTDQRDGHDFVATAFEHGAAAALVTHRPATVPADAPLLIVPDVLAALENLARAARDRMQGKVIGITGSVGKTGTKDMLRAILSEQGQVHAAEKSLNNHWGVPLTLARMPAKTEFAVIEIGMNAPGEIAPLSELARPHVALITTVAGVHAAAFEDVYGIAREKASILKGVEPLGIAILNRDIDTYPILQRKARQRGARIVSFGTEGRPDFRLLRAEVSGSSTSVSLRARGRDIFFKLATPGRHLALNAVAAMAAVEAVGADMTRAALTLAQWSPPEGRGVRRFVSLGDGVLDGGLLLIDDSYNANPTSMAAALDMLAQTQPRNDLGRVLQGRRVAFLTDMLELGDDAEAAHRALIDLPSMRHVDKVHCAGPLMQALHTALPYEKRGRWYSEAPELAAQAGRLLDAGDVVMVKGSKGSKASVIVDAIAKLGQSGPAERFDEHIAGEE